MRTMIRSRSKHQYPQAFLDMVEAAGFPSVHALGEAIGNTDALRNLARGRSRTLRSDTLHAVATRLSRPMEDVADALELPPAVSLSAGPIHIGPSDLQSPRVGAVLAVRHVVRTSAWLEFDAVMRAFIPSPPVIADSRFPSEAQWLELVGDDSADLYYPAGAFIHVVAVAAIGYAPQHEDFVVVERRRQQDLVERSVKQIFITRRKIELWPRSRNPQWATPLDLGGEGDSIVALVIGAYLPARR